MIRHEAALTPQKAIIESKPMFISHRGRVDDFLEAIGNLIWGVQESLNITQKMTAIQTFGAASLILDEYSDLTLDELILCFKWAKTGKFGKVFNRMDIQVICEWLQLYRISDERLTYLENRHKKSDTKEPLFNNADAESALKLKEIYENLNKPKVRKAVIVSDLSSYEELKKTISARVIQMSIPELKALRKDAAGKQDNEIGKIIDNEIESRDLPPSP